MLIAGSLLGVVGAILAVPFAAVIKTVLREAGAPRRARMAALREASGPQLLELQLDLREALDLLVVEILRALRGEDRDGDAGDQRDQAHAGQHQHGADDPAGGGFGDDVAVADGGDGLTAHQNDRPMSVNVCGSTIRTSTPPTTTSSIATSTIVRIARNERQALHPDANTGSIRHDRRVHERPPIATAGRSAGTILAFRPGALFVFDTR